MVNTHIKNEKLVRPSPEEEVAIYREFLIRLATARWTMNSKKVSKLLQKVDWYFYVRANSNGDEEQEAQDMIRTLLDLKT